MTAYFIETAASSARMRNRNHIAGSATINPSAAPNTKPNTRPLLSHRTHPSVIGSRKVANVRDDDPVGSW